MRSAIVSLTLGAALGATDVTPPVISLSLVDGTPQKAGTVCEVQDATTVSCPLPICTVHDHHDGDLTCTEKFYLVNDNNLVLEAKDANSYGSIKRDLRSEWLVTYDAVDKSDNHAETVSFSFRIEDTKAPVLSTRYTKPVGGGGAPVNAVTHAENGAASAKIEKESCSSVSANAPCTYWLDHETTAFDAYDLDVTDRIKVQLVNPESEYVVGSEDEWVLQNTLSGGLALDTQSLGDWTLKYRACDKADFLGLDEADNCWTQTVTIGVADNTKPIITVTGGQIGSDAWKGVVDTLNPTGGGPGAPVSGTAAVDVLECNVDKYVEAGATCIDLHDSWSPELGRFVAKAASIHGDAVAWQTIDGTTGGTEYVVRYECEDALEQEADAKTRTVTVRDTRNPVVTLIGDQTIENSQGANKGKNPDWETDTGIHKELLNSQVTCTDECDQTPTIVRTLHYGEECTGALVGNGDIANFPEYTTGKYSIKYTCSDGTDGDARERLTDVVCRTIINVDHMHPIIKVLGADHMTLEATKTGNYIDDGATCSDQVDGVISQNVEVNGDVVNLEVPGTYNVEYNCMDAAQNPAPTAKRIVTVKHTSCPTCYLNGCDNVYQKTATSSHVKRYASDTATFEGCSEKHEASFPYTDAGATCADTIDGPLNKVGENYFVQNNVNAMAVGTYTITYRAKNSVGTWNDEACRGLSVKYVRTVEVLDTLKPVIRLKYAATAGSSVEIARSATADTGVNHEANPAYVNGIALNDGFMAEEQGSSTDVWLLAAAASAVTGLALLSVSSRATPVAVPV
jgi:hypothetical protein